jgi:hypothetical protein
MFGKCERAWQAGRNPSRKRVSVKMRGRIDSLVDGKS